jgi:hypothetical protein
MKNLTQSEIGSVAVGFTIEEMKNLKMKSARPRWIYLRNSYMHIIVIIL